MCSCGVVYIGKTSRSVETCIAEHRRCLRSGILAKSAVAKHHLETGHRILFDRISVVAKSSYYVQGKI